MGSARWMDLGLALAAAGTLALGLWLVPAGDDLATPGGEKLAGGCWLHEAGGVECPTCGMSRSYVAFLHGDVGASFRWHPAGPLMILGSIAALLAIAFFWLRRRHALWGRRGFGAALTGVALITLALGILRHLF